MALLETCVVRGDERTIFPKASNKAPKCRSEDWLLDFRRAFLSAKIARMVAVEFWNAYESRFPFQMAVVEMGTVPLVGSLLAEGLSRGKDANALVIRKSRKKDGLCNIVEGVANGLPTVLVDDIVNSGESLVKALLIARNEGIAVAECFCLCHFLNPDFAERLGHSPFAGMPVRSVFTLEDFGLERGAEKPGVPTFYAESEPLAELGEPHLGLVVPKSSPLVSDGALYASGESGKLVKIDLATKEILWEYRMEKTPHGKNVLSSVVDCGDDVCFGAYDGAVHFVNKETGRKRMAVSLAEWIGSTPEPDLENGRIFVGLEHAGSNGSVAACRISDGETLWETKFPDFVHASPAYDAKAGAVYSGTNGGEFVKLDADTGEILWKREFKESIKVRPTLSPDGKRVFFGCFDGELRCLDTKTGNTLWEYETPFNVYSEALGGPDGIFV